MSVAPTSVSIFGTGSSNAAGILVQEIGYGGTFSESDTCAGLATVAPSSGTGPAATFTVTGIAAGSCNVTFFDTLGQQVGAAVEITASGFGVNARTRGGT